MTTSSLLDMAQKQLADLSCPMPSDFMGEFSFPTPLLYAHKVLEATLASAAAFFATSEAEPDDEDTVTAEVLKSLGMGLMGVVHAMVVVGMYPPAAEEALETAQGRAMAQFPGQLVWYFDHLDADAPPGALGEPPTMAGLSSRAGPGEGTRARRPQTLGQAKAAQARRAERAGVAERGSALSAIDWTGTYCLRCEHLCSGRHRPGTIGLCKAPSCKCSYCLVRCECGADSADHEPWGAEQAMHCPATGCTEMRPVRALAR